MNCGGCTWNSGALCAIPVHRPACPAHWPGWSCGWLPRGTCVWSCLAPVATRIGEAACCASAGRACDPNALTTLFMGRPWVPKPGGHSCSNGFSLNKEVNACASGVVRVPPRTPGEPGPDEISRSYLTELPQMAAAHAAEGWHHHGSVVVGGRRSLGEMWDASSVRLAGGSGCQNLCLGKPGSYQEPGLVRGEAMCLHPFLWECNWLQIAQPLLQLLAVV